MNKDDKKVTAGETAAQYIDSKGKVFSAKDIIEGFTPSPPYKPHSLGKKILDNTGKVHK